MLTCWTHTNYMSANVCQLLKLCPPPHPPPPHHNPSHKKNSQWMFLLTTSSMWSCGRRQLLQLRIVWEFLLTNTPTNFSTSQSISLQHSYHSDTVLYIEKRNTYTASKKICFFFHWGWGHKILFCARKTCTLRPGIFTRTIGKIIATNAENQFWGNILQSDS